MSQLPVSNKLVYPIEVFHNTSDYWETINPIVPYMKAAHDTIKQTVRVGDGKTHYMELVVKPFMGMGEGGRTNYELATEDEPGVVSNLASEENVRNSVGDGVVRSKHVDTIIDTYKNRIVLEQVSTRSIGDRYLYPSDQIPTDAVKADGSTISKTDKRFPVLDTFLSLNTDQVITEAEWNAKSILSSGVGGVSFYCYLTNGDIRLPDERDSFISTVAADEHGGDFKEIEIEGSGGGGNTIVIEQKLDSLDTAITDTMESLASAWEIEVGPDYYITAKRGKFIFQWFKQAADQPGGVAINSTDLLPSYVDNNADGVPDYIENVYLTFITAYRLYFEILGLKSPMGSTTNNTGCFTVTPADCFFISLRSNSSTSGGDRLASLVFNSKTYKVIGYSAFTFEDIFTNMFYPVMYNYTRIKGDWLLLGLKDWFNNLLNTRAENNKTQVELLHICDNPDSQLYNYTTINGSSFFYPLANLYKDSSPVIPQNDRILNSTYLDGTKIMKDFRVEGLHVLRKIFEKLADAEIQITTDLSPSITNEFGNNPNWSGTFKRSTSLRPYVVKVLKELIYESSTSYKTFDTYKETINTRLVNIEENVGMVLLKESILFKVDAMYNFQDNGIFTTLNEALEYVISMYGSVSNNTDRDGITVSIEVTVNNNILNSPEIDMPPLWIRNQDLSWITISYDVIGQSATLIFKVEDIVHNPLTLEGYCPAFYCKNGTLPKIRFGNNVNCVSVLNKYDRYRTDNVFMFLDNAKSTFLDRHDIVNFVQIQGTVLHMVDSQFICNSRINTVEVTYFIDAYNSKLEFRDITSITCESDAIKASNSDLNFGYFDKYNRNIYDINLPSLDVKTKSTFLYLINSTINACAPVFIFAGGYNPDHGSGFLVLNSKCVMPCMILRNDHAANTNLVFHSVIWSDIGSFWYSPNSKISTTSFINAFLIAAENSTIDITNLDMSDSTEGIAFEKAGATPTYISMSLKFMTTINVASSVYQRCKGKTCVCQIDNIYNVYNKPPANALGIVQDS